MQKLAKAHVLIVGLGGVGVEVGEIFYKVIISF